MRSWWIPCVVVDDASAVGPSLSEDCVFHVVSRWRKCPIVSICHTGHVHTCRTPQASVGRHYSSLQFVAECVRALGKDGAPSVVGGNFRNLSNIERKIENARERLVSELPPKSDAKTASHTQLGGAVAAGGETNDAEVLRAQNVLALPTLRRSAKATACSILPSGIASFGPPCLLLQTA